MKCLSRSTLGVVIGCINIFCFAILIIYVITIIYGVSNLSEEDKRENAEILTTSITLLYLILVVFVISLLTSVLLVAGIIKQRHKYMKPWIFSAMVGMGFHCLRLIISIVVAITTGVSFGSIIAAIVVGLLILALEFLIFYPIYTLYTDFRDASITQEQLGLKSVPQNPPSYGELERAEEMYN